MATHSRSKIQNSSEAAASYGGVKLSKIGYNIYSSVFRPGPVGCSGDEYVLYQEILGKPFSFQVEGGKEGEKVSEIKAGKDRREAGGDDDLIFSVPKIFL